MSRFWCSWRQPGEDPRPLHDPPKDERVLGWWVSGDGGDGKKFYYTLCALIKAGTSDQAGLALKKDWPEFVDWRFCEERADDWVPGDRFVLKPWMTKRMKTKKPKITISKTPVTADKVTITNFYPLALVHDGHDMRVDGKGKFTMDGKPCSDTKAINLIRAWAIDAGKKQASS